MLKKGGVPIDQQAELRELLDAVRRAGYAEGYAAAKMEAAMGAVGTQATTPDPATATATAAAAQRPLDEMYVPRTPLNTTKAIALEYMKNMDRAVSPTEIVKNTIRQTGVRLTQTTLRRALDALAAEGAIMKVDNSRWQIKKTELVPLRPIR
jgi:hypothetical protein